MSPETKAAVRDLVDSSMKILEDNITLRSTVKSLIEANLQLIDVVNKLKTQNAALVMAAAARAKKELN